MARARARALEPRCFLRQSFSFLLPLPFLPLPRLSLRYVPQQQLAQRLGVLWVLHPNRRRDVPRLDVVSRPSEPVAEVDGVGPGGPDEALQAGLGFSTAQIDKLNGYI